MCILSVLILTGCDSEDTRAFFGETGTLSLKFIKDFLGESYFGDNDSAIAYEPQANEESPILYDYNVKEVEKSPKEEKPVYDYSGPVNDGIPTTRSEVIDTETSLTDSILQGLGVGTTSDGPIIILSSGHCQGGNSDLEFIRMESYSIAMIDLVMKYVDQQGLKVEYKFGEKFKSNKELAKNICNSDGKVTKRELIAKFESLGVIESTGKGTYGLTKLVLKKPAKYYKKYGDAIENTILAFINEHPNSKLTEWATKCKVASGGNTTIPNSWKQENPLMFKACSSTGTSYNGLQEYEVNWAITVKLKKLLEKDGYTVILSRSSKDSHKLDDGQPVSNRNMSLFAQEQPGAVLHLIIHWEGAGGKQLMHCVTGSVDTIGGNAVSIAEEVSAAIKSSNTNLVSDSIRGGSFYTGLNWQAVPTIELECGALDVDGAPYVVNGAFNAKKWLQDGHYKIILAGVEKAVELSTADTEEDVDTIE